jgi:hypothetical protein
MGDGPPWIQNVYRDKPPGGWLDSAPYPHNAAVTFHFELDKNKRWGNETAFERPADNKNELTAILARPGEFNLAQRLRLLLGRRPTWTRMVLWGAAENAGAAVPRGTDAV